MELLNSIFSQFFVALQGATQVLTEIGFKVLAICATAYMLWKMVPFLTNAGEHMGDALATFILTIAGMMIYSWVLLNWSAMTEAGLEMMRYWAGSAVGTVGASLLESPGALWEMGQKAVTPIAAFDTWQKGYVSTYSVVATPLHFICYLIILVSFFWLTVNYGMALVEWYFAVVCGATLVPLGYLRPLGHLGESAVGWLSACTIRIFVLLLLVAIAFPLFERLGVPPPDAPPATPVFSDPMSGMAMPGMEAAPKMGFTLTLAGAAFLYGLLAWLIPGRAARLAGAATMALGGSDIVAGAMMASRTAMLIGSAAVSPIRGTSRMILNAGR